MLAAATLSRRFSWGPMSETPPDVEQLTATGAEAHYRRLEALYRSAPVNRHFESEIEITGPGQARDVARDRPGLGALLAGECVTTHQPGD